MKLSVMMRVAEKSIALHEMESKLKLDLEHYKRCWGKAERFYGVRISAREVRAYMDAKLTAMIEGRSYPVDDPIEGLIEDTEAALNDVRSSKAKVYNAKRALQSACKSALSIKGRIV